MGLRFPKKDPVALPSFPSPRFSFEGFTLLFPAAGIVGDDLRPRETVNTRNSWDSDRNEVDWGAKRTIEGDGIGIRSRGVGALRT